MLIHPLAERLRTLGMAAMADALLEMQNHSAAADLTREDWLGLLLDREVTARDSKRLTRRLSQARLRQNAIVETPTSGPRVASTVPCSTNSPRVTGFVIASTW
jgi:hypothetical protein